MCFERRTNRLCIQSYLYILYSNYPMWCIAKAGFYGYLPNLLFIVSDLVNLIMCVWTKRSLSLMTEKLGSPGRGKGERNKAGCYRLLPVACQCGVSLKYANVLRMMQYKKIKKSWHAISMRKFISDTWCVLIVRSVAKIRSDMRILRKYIDVELLGDCLVKNIPIQPRHEMSRSYLFCRTQLVFRNQ